MENKLIYKKLIAVMNKCGSIGKDRKNTGQGYNFRGIDDVMNELHGYFSDEGVFILPEVLDSVREERTSKTGSATFYTNLKVKFTFMAEDGSSVSSIIAGEAMDSGDKSTNKALSAALKYALLQMFLIPTEEKKDSEFDNHEIKPKKLPEQSSEKPETQYQDDERPWLEEKQFKDMLAFIADGKKDAVKARMKGYKMKREYKTQLENALNN